MSKVSIGLIGAGMIGDVHIDRIRRDGRGEVKWIAGRTAKTVKDKLHKFKIPFATTDYRDILKDRSVDAVIIASPPYTHLQMVKECLAAQKHILLEKPMVVNRHELDELLDLVSDYPDLKVVECSCRHARLQPKFTFIKKMIADGLVGEVYHIHHQSVAPGTFIEYNPAAAWAHQKQLAGGGPLIDWGVYDLSFHLGILQDVPQIKSIKSVVRSGLKVFKEKNFISDIEEHGAAYLEFDNGLTYYYERGAGAPAIVPHETRLYGTKGSLRFVFCSWEPVEVDYYHFESSGAVKHDLLKINMPPDHDDNLAMAHHFLDVLLENVAPQMTVSLAGKHLDILFRIVDDRFS